LELAGVVAPGRQYRDQAIFPMTGKSLLPLLAGTRSEVRAPDEPLGYELSGNRALFRGALKLTMNSPPVGDGQWRLYDIQKDPGETRDLTQALPEMLALMQKDYESYAKAHGVLPMPSGYNPVRAVGLYGLHNYWLPTYGLPAGGALVVLLGALLVWRRHRRKAKRQASLS
jgi:hypothetical protein